jgi:hypothetical protein
LIFSYSSPDAIVKDSTELLAHPAEKLRADPVNKGYVDR